MINELLKTGFMRDLTQFLKVQQDKVYDSGCVAKGYGDAENDVNSKIENLKKHLPEELYRQVIDLDEAEAKKEFEGSFISYEKGVHDGAKLILTLIH